MPVVKKRNLQTETRLLLEGNEPLSCLPAEIEDRHVLVQFEKFKPFIGELLEELRDGTLAEPVPVMNDGSTFAIHGDTRTFWVKTLACRRQRHDKDRPRPGDQLHSFHSRNSNHGPDQARRVSLKVQGLKVQRSDRVS